MVDENGKRNNEEAMCSLKSAFFRIVQSGLVFLFAVSEFQETSGLLPGQETESCNHILA